MISYYWIIIITDALTCKLHSTIVVDWGGADFNHFISVSWFKISLSLYKNVQYHIL